MSAIDTRSDGMMSVLNRVSAERARIGNGGGGPESYYSPDVIYSTDGIAKRIIDKPAEDAISSGFTIEGDEKNDILNEFDRLDVSQVFVDALRWTRLHGGAAVLLLAQDGGLLTDPLNIGNIKVIEDLICYAANVINPGNLRYDDPTKRNYGWPSLYEIRPTYGQPFWVHETRLITFTGSPIPPSMFQQTAIPWIGLSALDSCYADICRYRAGLRLSQAILERKQQLIHKMSSLGDMLANGMDEVVAKRLGIADAVRGVYNMLAVDAADDVVLADSNLGGLGEVIRDYKVAVCAASGIPMPILFGEQTAGLNVNAEGELSIYHGIVNGYRERNIRVAIEKLAGWIWAQRQLPSTEPQRWQVKFNPLWSPSAKEVADVAVAKSNARKIHMDAVAVMLDTQTVTPEEVRAATAMAFPELELDPAAVPAVPDDVTATADTTAQSGQGDAGGI